MKTTLWRFGSILKFRKIETDAIESNELTHDSKKENKSDLYINFSGSNSSVSKEFLRQRAEGKEPFCSFPWRRLDVVLRDNRTKVCCSFPVKLPRFDWPTMEEFHSEEHMWNHPFMQRMRRTMGTAHEMPACTLCLTTNKRARENAERRREVAEETREIYKEVEARIYKSKYRGHLNERDIESFSHCKCDLGKGTIEWLTEKREFYRAMIRSRQLYERGHILQLGSRLPAISAFLAEANERLDVADFTLERLDRVVELTKFIGLDVAMHRLKATGRLPFGDGTFDGVWLDGEMLYQADRKYFLEEVRRVLRPAGKMHVRRAFGPGEVLRRMLVNRSGEGGRGLDSDALRRAGIDGIDHVGAALPERCLRAPGFEPGIGLSGKAAALASGIADAVWARRALLAGTRHDGPGNFFVAGDLRRIMRLCGFAVDQTVAIHRDAAAVEGGGKTLLEHVGEDEEISGAVGRYLNKSVNGDEAHFTIDNFLSFNVVSDEGIRKEMYKSMQSGNVLTS